METLPCQPTSTVASALPTQSLIFFWTIRCESGDRNVQWSAEWGGSNHGKNCVCLHACVRPKPCQWHGPSEEVGHDRGGHWVKAAISGNYHGQQEHAASVATLSSWGSAGSGHAGVCAWVWRSRRRKCPHSWATRLLGMEAWRGSGARSTSRANLPTTPVPGAAQDEGL